MSGKGSGLFWITAGFSEASASRRNSTNMDRIRSSTWPRHLLMRRAHLPPHVCPVNTEHNCRLSAGKERNKQGCRSECSLWSLINSHSAENVKRVQYFCGWMVVTLIASRLWHSSFILALRICLLLIRLSLHLFSCPCFL